MLFSLCLLVPDWRCPSGMQAVYSALRQGYIYILSRVDRLAALKGAAEPRKRRLKAQWFYMSKIIYLFIYLFILHLLSVLGGWVFAGSR